MVDKQKNILIGKLTSPVPAKETKTQFLLQFLYKSIKFLSLLTFKKPF